MKKIIISCVIMLFIGILFAAGAENLVVIGFDPMDRDSRYITGMLDRRDFNNVLGADSHFNLIIGREVSSAMKSANISSSMEILTSQEAGIIGESLDASIVIWGTVVKVSDTMFRISGSMRSMRSGTVSPFSLQVSKDRNQRENAIRTELLSRLLEFSKGEMGKMFDIAIQQFNNKQYESAENQFLKIVSIEKDNMDAYYYLGYIQFEQNRFAQAVEYYNQGLAIEPTNENLLLYVSEAYRRQGLLDKAIEALEKVAQSKSDKVIYYNIAILYKDRGLAADAMSALDRALALDEEYLVAHTLYAEIAYDNRFFEKAIPHLVFITNINPDDEDSARKLALSYQRTGQLDKAIERYQGIIAADKNNVRAYLNLASAYRAIAFENTSEASKYNRLALQAFLDALKIDANNARIEVSIADVYYALNDLANSEKFARSAKQKQSNLYEASTLIGMIIQRRGIDKYNSYVELQNRTDSGNLYGKELDDTITLRDKTKNEAHDLFNQADRLFKEALGNADSERVKNDINQKIQANQQYISQTKPDFFN